MLLDADGNYLYVSPQIEEWLGYSPSEFYRDADIRQKIIHPDDLEATEAFHRTGRSSGTHTVEYRWHRRDGKYRWASGAIFPIYENAEDEQLSKVSMVQVVVQDISERKEAESQIRASLAKKEVLLKEIHHRVKNNLQIISSLLHLQATKLEDEMLLEAFEDSQNRIRSMALIHEELYNAADLAHIDFDGYMQRLTDNLFESFGVDVARIRMAIEGDSVSFTIDKAIPMGLIVNELVTNSLKYAFPENRPGEIRISLNAPGDGPFSLTISDDGVGFPDDIDYRNPQTLGLRLVGTLASQLEAHLELERSGGGSTFRIVSD
jgi:PAS domain S-box-containing protein